jgi:UMF1 family MFS transporter
VSRQAGRGAGNGTSAGAGDGASAGAGNGTSAGAGDAASAGAGNGASAGALYAWALYDLANTTFSLNVVSRYLPLLVVEDLGGRDLHVSVAYSSAMVVVALTAPLLGALSDASGRRLPFLAVTTFGCIAATALMGVGTPMTLVLTLFAVATYFYNAALVFYDALLANVSDEATRGRASALGVGLGYGGTIISLYSVAPIAERFGKASAFPATALLFFVFALPCFVMVPDRGAGALWRRGLAAETFTRVVATVRKLRLIPGLGRFLCAHFLYTDAVNTVVLFMALYVTRVGGFSSPEVTRLLALSTVFAIVGAFGQGPVIDRLGAKRALYGSLALWAVGLGLAGAAPGKGALWLVGPITGTALGALWAADRVVMFRLSPPEALGEFYGIYGMVGRFSAITGPLVWGAVVYALEDTGAFAYRAAIGTLLVMLLAGTWVLRRIPAV